MPAVPEISRLAGDALVILLHMAAALSHLREGNVNSAVKGLSEIIDNAVPGRYVNEAQYWRARTAESQDDLQAKVAAIRDYADLLKRLPDGSLKREVQLRLTALTEPGKLLSADEAADASLRSLERIGKALHDYAADNGGAFPDMLQDLMDEYVSDAALLVRPGTRKIGGARPYLYQGGLRADLRPSKDSQNEKALKVDGVCAIVWEPIADAEGARLILCIDGDVRKAKLPEE